MSIQIHFVEIVKGNTESWVVFALICIKARNMLIYIIILHLESAQNDSIKAKFKVTLGPYK